MLLESPKCRFFGKLYFFSVVLVMLSSIIGRAFSALNSISVIVLFLVWVFEGDFKVKAGRLKQQPLFFILSAFYCLFISGIFHSQDVHFARFVAQRELPLIIVPAVLLSKPAFSKRETALIYTCFSLFAFLWMALATGLAVRLFWQTGERHVFFYHALVRPLGSSAIYASMVCMLALIVLEKTSLQPRWKCCVYVAFSGWLVLLSSKMFLLIYVLVLLVFILLHVPRKSRLAAVSVGLVVFVGLCLSNATLRGRIADMANFRAAYLRENAFNSHMYFDGLSLRLVYIRFSYEIVKEQHAFWVGAGTGDAEKLLKNKIRQYHMYTGDGSQENGGYLRYSFHNVYLESLVSMGLPGLFINLLLFGYILYLGFMKRSPLLLGASVVLILSGCSDVIVLNSQFDVAMIMVIVCAGITEVRPGRERKDILDVITAN